MERNHWSAKTGISEVGTYWRPLRSCGGGLPKNPLAPAARKYLILSGWRLADIAAHKQMFAGQKARFRPCDGSLNLTISPNLLNSLFPRTPA